MGFVGRKKFRQSRKQDCLNFLAEKKLFWTNEHLVLPKESLNVHRSNNFYYLFELFLILRVFLLPPRLVLGGVGENAIRVVLFLLFLKDTGISRPKFFRDGLGLGMAVFTIALNSAARLFASFFELRRLGVVKGRDEGGEDVTGAFGGV